VQNTNQGAAVIDRKDRYSLRIEILAYPTYIRDPRYGGSCWNIAMPFGTEKLEWWGYPMVKKVRRYVYEHKVHLVECRDVIAVDEHCKRGLSEDVCRLNVVCSNVGCHFIAHCLELLYFKRKLALAQLEPGSYNLYQ